MEKERKTFMEKHEPSLQSMCNKAGVALRVIDLRWGVTNEEANTTNMVVQNCMDGVDTCRHGAHTLESDSLRNPKP